jgi:hypothetical protein
MSIEPRPPQTMTVIGAVLLLLTLFCWIGFVANATSMHESDPAGNSITQAFAFLSGGQNHGVRSCNIISLGLT